MTRVLFVSTSTTVGGAEKTLYLLATRLDPERFQVAGAVSLKPFGEYARRLASAGVPTETLGMSGRPGPSHVRALIEIIRREKPDVVHALMYQAIQLCRLAKKGLGGEASFRLISSPRVSYRTRGRLTLWVDRWLKGEDDLLIAESEASRKDLLGRLGYDPAKVQVVYNGVEPAARGPEAAAKRLELGLGEGEVLLGAVGRLDRQKGHDVLLEALARLPAGRAWRCAIVGDGPERAALEARLRALGLEKKVLFLGERADAAAWLSALDVFVLPSRWEGLPNSLLEAMALGAASAASAVDGVPEVVTDGKDGLLLAPEDPAALAAALDRLIADPALRERLGQAARRRVESDFTLPGMLERYQALYRG